MRERFSNALSWTVFSGVLLLMILTAVPYGTVDAWWEAAFQCSVFVLAGLWIMDALVRRSWSVSDYHLLLPLISLVLFALFQSIPLRGASDDTWISLSADPFETLRFALRLISLTIMIGLLLACTSSVRRLRWLVHSVITLGVASAIFGIVRQATQHNDSGWIFAYLMPGEGYAQFVNANHFAFLMEMALGVILGTAIGGGVTRDRLLIYVAAAIPVFAALVLCNSRGGLLAIFSQLGFIVVGFGAVRPGSQRKGGGWADRISHFSRMATARALLSVCLAVVVGFCVILIGADPLVDKLETLEREADKAQSNHQAVRRVEIWGSTWDMIKSNPIAGVGFGGYWIAIPEYHRASGEETPQEAHNDYLELLASGGIIGAVLGMIFVITFLRASLKQLKASDRFRRAASFGALIGIFGIAVHSVVDFGLHITVNAVVFGGLVVIASRSIGDADKRSSSERSRISRLDHSDRAKQIGLGNRKKRLVS